VPGQPGAVRGEPAELPAPAQPVLDEAQAPAELAVRAEAVRLASDVAGARALKDRADAGIAAASVPLFALLPVAEPAERAALADVGLAAQVRFVALLPAAVFAEPAAFAGARTAAVPDLFSLRQAGRLEELAERAGAETLALPLCSVELVEPEALLRAHSAVRHQAAGVWGVGPPASPQPVDVPRGLCSW